MTVFDAESSLNRGRLSYRGKVEIFYLPSKFHITSPRDALAAAMDVGRFVSAIQVEISNIFSSTVKLPN